MAEIAGQVVLRDTEPGAPAYEGPIASGDGLRHAPRMLAPDPKRRSRGQVLIIFALTIFVFIGLCAVVVDVAWYWANSLRIQRAADAAALAGVVHLPNDVPSAVSVARAEATKNGYTDGIGGYTVTPTQDPANPRRLRVEIAGPVGTYFAHVLGVNSFPAVRRSRAEFILPVPMGSPEAYYGVGFYQGLQTTNSFDVNNTDYRAASGNSGGGWSNEDRAYTNNDQYTTESTNGEQSIWRDFGLQGGTVPIPNDPTLEIRGIEVRLTDASLTGSGFGTNCRVGVEMSWDGGTTWSTSRQSNPLTTGVDDKSLIGDAGTFTDLALWGAHPWAYGDFSNTNFRVRLTWVDGNANCSSTQSVQVDQIEVRVMFRTTVTTTTNQVLSVPNPLGGTLASQGFWGAVFTPGGVRENGDRYAPDNIGRNNPPDGTNDGPNPTYDANGYNYTIEVGASGQVRLFDPIFCATGTNGSGGWLGAGDHWTTRGGTGSTVIAPVGVTFKLFKDPGTPFDTSDDAAVGSTLAYDPGSATLGDLSGSFGTPQNNTDVNRQDCSSNPAHNQWVLPSGWNGLTAGTYRLNVNTSLDADNANVGAENLWSIWVNGGAGARIYGGGRMAAYTNLDETGSGGNQTFYFAQIEAVHSGKQMIISLFDPGEASAPSWIRFLTPDGGTYHYATFDWVSNDGRSGNDVTEIQTSDGNPLFNNRLLTITVDLTGYGTVGGLDPNGIGEEGWWLVEYDVQAGNDTTTWEVSIRGNPVHLVVP